MVRWVYSLSDSLNISFPTVGREERCGFPLTLSKVPCHASPPAREPGLFFLYIWPNLYQSDCSIFGMGLEAAAQSLFFICSKHLSVNVNGTTEVRDRDGLPSFTFPGSSWLSLLHSSVGVCMSSTQSEMQGRLCGRCPWLTGVCSDVITLLGEEPGHPCWYSVCLVWVVHNSASFGDLETTLGAASFPRVRLKKKSINNLKFQCRVHLWTCRELVRLKPWKRCSSVPTVTSLFAPWVAVFPQFHLLKTYITYLIFFLARGVGELFFMEC